MIKALRMVAVLAGLTAFVFGSAPASAKTFVYVSTATDGLIDIFTMDDATGVLMPSGKFDAGKMVMPMAVSPDKKYLYAVLRSQPYRVLTLAIDPPTGALKQVAVAALPDSMPYVSTDITGRLLFSASYGGNKLAVLPINSDGLIVDGAHQVIVTGRNAHSIVNDRSGKYVFATNLGSDAVLQFVLNPETGMLEPNDPPGVSTKPGFGPRHIAISPDNRSVYVVTELTGHVIHYALDNAKGTLTEIESVPSVPAEARLVPGITPSPPPPFNAATAPAGQKAPADIQPRIWAADIGITPDGKFLYTTERTSSKIALFSVARDTGNLTYIADFSTTKQPRGIRIDASGRFLIAAGEKSEWLSVNAINQADGTLTEVGRYPVDAGASWIEIISWP